MRSSLVQDAIVRCERPLMYALAFRTGDGPGEAKKILRLLKKVSQEMLFQRRRKRTRTKSITPNQKEN